MNERNKVIELTDNQLSPNRAKPEDFHVIESHDPDQFAIGLPFDGACGDTLPEYNALLKVGPKSRGDGDRIKKSNQDVANQRVAARENRPSTDGKKKR